eukprot:1139599-Rhodomonas_salina.1
MVSLTRRLLRQTAFVGPVPSDALLMAWPRTRGPQLTSPWPRVFGPKSASLTCVSEQLEEIPVIRQECVFTLKLETFSIEFGIIPLSPTQSHSIPPKPTLAI